jgi:hypothetical protein
LYGVVPVQSPFHVILIPDDPEVPEVPEVPDVPLEPEVPDEPLVPDVPEVPLVPDDPEVPDFPLDPDVPDDPEQGPLFVTVILTTICSTESPQRETLAYGDIIWSSK